MLPCTTKIADLPFKPVGVILSGGPYSVVWTLWTLVLERASEESNM